ncbi:uncharacterized protein Dsimw501_GD10657 [Drosophila simulans]|uniref:Uncharacterized protein n=1 Tax=Drosophila simulans TaxID=7240 RepID=A0A0J9R8W8_DROSI|nr:uncharacterized protein Dsimw501_GD10657 [Drosophila simulans]
MAGYRSLPLAPVAATAAVQPTMGGVPPTMAAYAHHQSMTAMSNNGIIYQSAVHARELQGWHFFTTRLTPYGASLGHHHHHRQIFSHLQSALMPLSVSKYAASGPPKRGVADPVILRGIEE